MFFRADAEGLILTARAMPKASRNSVVGTVATPDGPALKIAITAPADKGKANTALIAMVADAFGVAKRNVKLLSGNTSRHKVLRVAGDPAALSALAQAWVVK